MHDTRKYTTQKVAGLNKVSCLVIVCRYLKFQATHKLTRFFEGWAKRHIAGTYCAPTFTYTNIPDQHTHMDIICEYHPPGSTRVLPVIACTSYPLSPNISIPIQVHGASGG